VVDVCEGTHARLCGLGWPGGAVTDRVEERFILRLDLSPRRGVLAEIASLKDLVKGFSGVMVAVLCPLHDLCPLRPVIGIIHLHGNPPVLQVTLERQAEV
jgi:hypothetical protein